MKKGPPRSTAWRRSIRCARGRQRLSLAGGLSLALTIMAWPVTSTAQPTESSSSEGAVETTKAAGGDEQEGPDQAACLEAHAAAQALRRETRFIEAQEKLLICSSATCPGPVIEDCGGWIGELERRTPSLAFSVKIDGIETQDGVVMLDGKAVTDRAGITKVDPGRHEVRIEMPPYDAREQVVFARDGAGTQLVNFDFTSSKQDEAVAPAPSFSESSEPSDTRSRPTPVAVYPLLGVGGAGLISFGVFGLIGNQRKTELQEECEPDCTDEQLKPMKNAYLIGDISLAVGAVSLLTASVIYLTRPTESADLTHDTSFEIQPVVGVDRRGSFGVVAVQRW